MIKNKINNLSSRFNKQKGMSILGIIIFGIILILILSYLNINIKSFIDSPSVQENISYAGGVVKSLWVNYLAKPASFIWNDVCVKLWKSFIYNMERIRDGKSTDFDKAANNLQIIQE